MVINFRNSVNSRAAHQSDQKAHTHPAWRVSISDCGRFAISSSQGFEGLKIWDIGGSQGIPGNGSGELVATVGSSFSGGSTNSDGAIGWGFSLFGDYVISGTSKSPRRLKVINWKTNECIHTFSASPDSSRQEITSVCISSFGDWLCSGDQSGVVKFWKSTLSSK